PPCQARSATPRGRRRAWPPRRLPPRSGARPIPRPSVLRALDAALLRDPLYQPALAIIGHRLAHDLARSQQGQVGDFAADLLDGARLLGLDLRGGPNAQALELLAGGRDVRVTGLLGDLLGAGQDLVRLTASLGQCRDPLLLRVLPDQHV